MRKTLLSTLAVAVLLGASSVTLAQQAMKPVAVVSLAGYDGLKADIELIGNLGGNPNVGKGLEGFLTLMTGGKGLAGLDKAKPWGAVLQTDGQEFPVVAFLPVTDLKQLVAVLASLGGNPPPEPGADGIYQVEAGGQTIFLVEKTGWAFASNTREALASAPADPIKVLDGLDKKYDVAVKLSIKNVPDSIRQMAIGLLQMGAQAGLEQEPGESDEQFALRSKLTQQSLQQTIQTINDLETVLIGLSIDREAKAARLDLTVTAATGTKTAEDFAQMGDLKSDFAGLSLPGAAVVAHFAGKLTEADVTQMKSSLTSIRARAMKELANQGLPEEGEKKARELTSGLFEVIEATIDSKVMDAGASVRLAPGAATVVTGGHLADGAKLEKLIKEIAEVAKQERPDLAQFIKLDAEQYEGVNFHLVSAPLPADDPGAQKLAKLVGDKLEMIIAIGPKSGYVAIGRDAAKTLKEVIDKSKAEAGKAVLPMQVSVALGPIFKFVAETADDPHTKQTAGMFADILAQTGGKDHLNITGKAVPNGATVQVELEEGLLKAIGMSSKMMVPGGPGGPGALPPGF